MVGYFFDGQNLQHLARITREAALNLEGIRIAAEALP
jgi:hypothetical protein